MLRQTLNLILMDITFKDHSSDSSFATINLSFIYPTRSELVDSVLFIDSNNELIFSINNGQLILFNQAISFYYFIVSMVLNAILFAILLIIVHKTYRD